MGAERTQPGALERCPQHARARRVRRETLRVMREREQRQRSHRGSGSATEATLETVESAALVAAVGLQGYTTVRAAKQQVTTNFPRSPSPSRRSMNT